jgi:hypothetical protein
VNTTAAAIFTEVLTAVLAVVLDVIDPMPAVMAVATALPIRNRSVGAVGVVGQQRLFNDLEEIAEPAGPDGTLQR